MFDVVFLCGWVLSTALIALLWRQRQGAPSVAQGVVLGVLAGIAWPITLWVALGLWWYARKSEVVTGGRPRRPRAALLARLHAAQSCAEQAESGGMPSSAAYWRAEEQRLSAQYRLVESGAAAPRRKLAVSAACVVGAFTSMVLLGWAAPTPTTSGTATARTETAPSPTSTQPAPAPVRGVVVEVVDGDTIDVTVSGDRVRVRALGIDTPETVAPGQPVECWGPEATEFAERTLNGQQVRLDADPSQDVIDSYGRALAYVVLPDGTDYSVAAAAAGVARSFVHADPVRKWSEIGAAEARARTLRLGLWGSPCEGRLNLPPPPPPLPAPLPEPQEELVSESAPSSDCDPNYEGACVPIASDVDCEGGRGNGPAYVSGPVRVVGRDIYGLDRDKNGEGCE